jgi:hypothetical protein
MFSGVFVLRRIAAAHVPAHHAHAQVNPAVTEFYALCADVNIGGLELDLIQMFAFL